MRGIVERSRRFFASNPVNEGLGLGMHRNFLDRNKHNNIRLSKLLATSIPAVSRREAEKSIGLGKVSIDGEVILRNNSMDVNVIRKGVVKYNGKIVSINTDFTDKSKKKDNISEILKVWAVNKLQGELVTHHDPQGRPTLIERLRQGGGSLTKYKDRLKPIGRLDMNTEGLILITTCGKFARELELPSNALHRSYRVRVHGKLTPNKLHGLRRGMDINGTRYKGMDISIENPKSSSRQGTNTWLQVKCIEGKNRQIRKCMEHFGLKVTRLIRTSFGDYNLHSIPPGMAIEVPFKPIHFHKKRGTFSSLILVSKNQTKTRSGEQSNPVQWINNANII